MAFSYTEKLAITVENGNIHLWVPEKSADTGRQRIFKDKNPGRKAVLFDAGTRWWENNKEDAPYCEYASMWLGDFPYGSWAWCIRKCKISKKIDIYRIFTDINPSGISEYDRWIAECKTYVPESVAV